MLNKSVLTFYLLTCVDCFYYVFISFYFNTLQIARVFHPYV